MIILLLNLSPLVITRGDLLKRTLCYCGTDNHPFRLPEGEDGVQGMAKRGSAPPKPDPTVLQTFWYSFEYYNVHLNQTFTMEETCTSNYTFPDNILTKDCWNYRSLRTKYCKHFHSGRNGKFASHGRRKHHFCYHFHRVVRDTYSFDGQIRHVSQYPLYLLGSEVQEICEPICREKFGMPLMKGRWYLHSSVSTIFDEADMCRHCA